MGETRRSHLISSWRALLEVGPVAAMTDAMLLEQFATCRGRAGEMAFAALVSRHGRMVRRVCGRLLVDPADADDAFQATFLILARKAQAIRRPERLSSWLYGTAHRTSRKLKVQSARRRRHEAGAALPERAPGIDVDRVEEAEIVLEEIARLPDACRAAVVLCGLEGRTQDEAARSLGCSDRTLRRRLDRANDLLRARLLRRGLAPATAILASAVVPEPAIAALPAGAAEAIARAALRFTAGEVAAGAVPTSAVLLAEGVIKTMLSIKIKAIAATTAMLLMLGLGAGVGLGSAHAPASARGNGPAQDGKGAMAAKAEPSPAEQYQALVKRYDDAVKVYQEAASAKSPEEASRLWVRLGPDLGDLGPRFVALAERYPKDPAAVDALLWVVEKTTSGYDTWESAFSKVVGRAMQILARDHAGDPRLGLLCIELTGYESPRRDTFLRAIAERSPDRVVKGRATLAFAEYLRMKATHVEMLQHPDAPENLEKMKEMLIALAGPDALANTNPPLTDAAATLHKQREELAEHAPAYLKHLLAADPAAVHRESEQLYARVIKEFGDIPHVRFDLRPTRETLADVARRETGPRRPAPPGAVSRPLAVSFRSLDDAYQAAERAAQQVSNKIGPNEKGLEAYKAAAPPWADYGRKMWKLAEENPRHPDAFEALLWIVGHPIFFDNYEERAAITGQAVDALIGDHLDAIAADLAARDVAKAFNMGHPFPAPHIDRLYRALYQRSPNREARGRMGLGLARFLKAEADLAESFATRGLDPRSRPELAIWPPSYIARVGTTDPRELRREAETVLERVKADYGDIKSLNGMVLTNEPLAAVADRELADVRTLAVGQPAPEITGEDVDGKPMALSEFRGKVVLLDFFSHTHGRSTRLDYPRLRGLVERYRNRPFVVLGISNNDAREALKDLETNKHITWRCWWDHARDDGPGPITTRWNIRGYSTFIVLDRDGTIRFKDLSPMDEKGFDEAIEALVKQAEAVATAR